MELKLYFLFFKLLARFVLIVPYGIETWLAVGQMVEVDYVLIVPYGIETRAASRAPVRAPPVLIVPYGIETLLSGMKLPALLVLIVPYGIETWLFNRSEVFC